MTSLMRRSWSASGVLAEVVIFTTSLRSENIFFSMASFNRSCERYSNGLPLRAWLEILIKISCRKVFFAFSLMPICSSIERMSFSSGSSSSSVIGSFSFSLLQYASTLSR